MRFIISILAIYFLLMIDLQAQKAVRWQPGSECCDSFLVNGAEVREVTIDGVTVTVTLIERRRWIPHAFISIENNSSERVTADPSTWTIRILGEKPRMLKSKDPDKLAESLQRRGAIAGALKAASGEFATTQSTGTVRGSDGKVSTVTVTSRDDAARARAYASGQQVEETFESVAAYVRGSSLRANTIMPKRGVYGLVWFEDKGYKEVVVTLSIEDLVFEFPFSKKK